MYLLRKRKKTFASLILAISLAGVGMAEAKPVVKPKARTSREAKAEVRAVTVKTVTKTGDRITLALSDGETITLPASRLRVAAGKHGAGSAARKARLEGDLKARRPELKAGDAVVLRIRRGPDGKIARARVLVFANLDEATKAVKAKRVDRAARVGRARAKAAGRIAK
jgi:co-chaperonin GroES (HSP10)